MHTWNLISQLYLNTELPIIIGEDWNEILCPSEKISGNDMAPHLMHNFQITLRQNRLLNLGFIGYPFTWKWGDLLVGGIRERLD